MAGGAAGGVGQPGTQGGMPSTGVGQPGTQAGSPQMGAGIQAGYPGIQPQGGVAPQGVNTTMSDDFHRTPGSMVPFNQTLQKLGMNQSDRFNQYNPTGVYTASNYPGAVGAPAQNPYTPPTQNPYLSPAQSPYAPMQGQLPINLGQLPQNLGQFPQGLGQMPLGISGLQSALKGTLNPLNTAARPVSMPVQAKAAKKATYS